MRRTCNERQKCRDCAHLRPRGNDALVLRRRSDSDTRLRQTGTDEFAFGAGRIRFIRGADGKVNEFSLSASRVFDLRFRRVE
jgi:hypothetical protein